MPTPTHEEARAAADALARRIGWGKTVLFSLLPLALLLAALEGAARLAERGRPPLPADPGLGFNPDSRLFVPSPEEPGVLITNPDKAASFKEQRFLMPKPDRHFRIFMLGGSSVNYIDLELTLLAWELTLRYPGACRVEIINCGGLAYGSHRLVAIAAEVMHYEPDLILIYSGHNEFEELEQFQAARIAYLPLQRVLGRFALYRFERDRAALWRIAAAQRDRNRRILENPEADYMSGARHVYTPEEVADRMRQYERNLSIILSLCRDHGVPVIIGTMASNLWKPGLATEAMREEVQALYAQGRHAEGMALARQLLRDHGRHQASDTENGIIRALAERYRIPIADVESAVITAEPHGIPGETLFSDHCHLNQAGNQILIRAYAGQIISLLDAPCRP
ncbi:MAG TPA: SGNH/GDSL hydrolase family protein [Candidatus Hydrogenedentes bacterium]|nr:SGNH/GDSL hydrolase family protein [Candidatus Hydrogenedentota bacterium]